MLEQIRAIEMRCEELERLLMQPEAAGDPASFRNLMKEYKSLEPIAETCRAYLTARKEEQEARQILAESGVDREMREIAQHQLEESRAAAERREEELKKLLLPHDPNDGKSVIVEIRSGAGGEEAALFAAVLYRMYTMYAERRGWKTELLSGSTTELGGFREVCFSVDGDGAYSRLKFESGVHRVQRVPETETQGRIHTSTVTVAVLPEAEEVELQIDPKDLKIDTYRSSGAGGQHINKTSSAIRITHLPTGTVVECQDERSQYKNKDKAMRVLRSRLYEAELRRRNERIAGERKEQVGTGDRSERIRTYNYPQGRVTDHRIGLTLYQLESVLDGNLDGLTDALMTHEQAEKLGENKNADRMRG